MNPQTHSAKETHFQCKQYSPLSVYDKHCKFYRDSNCNKTGERCAEWLRRNRAIPVTAKDNTIEKDLFGYPISNPQSRPQSSSSSPTPEKPMPLPPKPKPLSGFSPELIESFKALRTEICFTSDTGRFWLVPAYRDPSRGEITPEHLALICHALMAFPGATVTAFESLAPIKEVPE